MTYDSWVIHDWNSIFFWPKWLLIGQNACLMAQKKRNKILSRMAGSVFLDNVLIKSYDQKTAQNFDIHWKRRQNEIDVGKKFFIPILLVYPIENSTLIILVVLRGRHDSWVMSYERLKNGQNGRWLAKMPISNLNRRRICCWLFW